MVGVLSSSVADCRFKPWSKTKELVFAVSLVIMQQEGVRAKSGCLGNQDVYEWSEVSVYVWTAV